MQNWEWEQTTERCPRCAQPLLFADDPDSDTWKPTGVYRCQKCGFEATEQYFDGMDGGDWDTDDSFDDLDE